jgi:hypothetical protein
VLQLLAVEAVILTLSCPSARFNPTPVNVTFDSTSKVIAVGLKDSTPLTETTNVAVSSSVKFGSCAYLMQTLKVPGVLNMRLVG